MARKLTVSIWYCLRGLFQPFEKIDGSLEQKIGRIATVLGQKAITLLGFESNAAFVKRKTAILTARLKTTCLPALCVPRKSSRWCDGCRLTGKVSGPAVAEFERIRFLMRLSL